MAFYETFDVRRVDKNGKVSYRLRSLDVVDIESWEEVNEELTRIFTKGGDEFIAKIHFNRLTELCMSQNDDFGRLFAFFPN